MNDDESIDEPFHLVLGEFFPDGNFSLIAVLYH